MALTITKINASYIRIEAFVKSYATERFELLLPIA